MIQRSHKKGSSSGIRSILASLTACDIPSASHPLMIILLPRGLKKYEYVSPMHLACNGFIVLSFISTSIVVTSLSGSSARASVTTSVKYLLKDCFSNLLKIRLVVRSSGCNKCVIFFGICTTTIFNSPSLTLTDEHS